MISYFQAIVIGLLQGVTELFPISSLGHSVLLPAWLGWDHLVTAQSADESFYLAFVVALHVATALALLVYFRADWARIIAGFLRTLGHVASRLRTNGSRGCWSWRPFPPVSPVSRSSTRSAPCSPSRSRRHLPHRQRADPARR